MKTAIVFEQSPGDVFFIFKDGDLSHIDGVCVNCGKYTDEQLNSVIQLDEELPENQATLAEWGSMIIESIKNGEDVKFVHIIWAM